MNTPFRSQGARSRGPGLHVSRHRLLGGAVAALAIVALTSVAGTPPQAALGTAPPTILSFQTMIGNSGPYIGSAGAIRGIPAGGGAWKIAAAVGKLTANGQLTITVRGLVLVSTGMNPVPKFDGAVSCQSISSTGQANVVNVFTSDFPASPAGNSVISATVTLPRPCFAPIIFVTSPAPQSWFATTGM